MIDVEDLKAFIKGKIGKTIVSLETVDSTNTFAMKMGEEGAEHGTVVIAENQTHGRGRMGRQWISPPGRNIAMSVIVRPSLDTVDATLLTIMASVACCRALRETTGLPVTIKWPNDLMVDGKKAGGILTEIRSTAGRVIFAAIGIGINLNSETGDFPSELLETATSVKIETAREHPKEQVVAAVCNGMDAWCGTLAAGGREALLSEWRNLSSVLGKTVTVTMGDGKLRGTAKDLDGRGMLLLELPSGEVKTISAGDVTVLRAGAE